MPPFEFAGDVSWGYNPAHLFAIESGYGGPDAFKRFIKAAHEHGIAVILDVVYNHLGPTDLDLWQFDGWSANGGGGIYFYNDERAITPWGSTRPDYGRRRGPHVPARQCADLARGVPVRRPALRLRRCSSGPVDGVPGDPAAELPDGWSFMAWINDEIRARQPWKLTIAEDLQDDPKLVSATAEGGAGFGAQWDVRLRPRGCGRRSTAGTTTGTIVADVVAAITGEGRGAAADPGHLHRVARRRRQRPGRACPRRSGPATPAAGGRAKRATLGSALVLTSPGIPMLFQGQELLEDRWFDDTVALDWTKAEQQRGDRFACTTT